jgi:hypothetical protein
MEDGVALTIDQRVKRLLKPGTIARVTFNFSDAGVSAFAVPNSFHPVVTERQSLAFSGREAITVAEATEIRMNAMSTPVGRGHGRTAEDALAGLEADMKKLAKVPA